MRTLDVGCGLRKAAGAIGIDKDPNTQTDVIHDLNHFPYPFTYNEFDEIICNHVLEHLDDFEKVMNELHRITRNGGIIRIRVPHYTGVAAWGHTGHKRAFSAHIANCIRISMGTKFYVDKTSLHYLLYTDRDACLRNRILSAIIDRILNTNIKFSDRFLGYWIGGIMELYMELKVLK